MEANQPMHGSDRTHQGTAGSGNADAAEAPSCMKWGHDGELSAVDLQGILARLSAVDQQATQLMNCSLDS